MLKDHYIFHKKSIKILKAKKYKAHRGANDVVPEYVLPEQFHADHFEKVMAKAREAQKLLQKEKGGQFEKDKVELPT